MAEFSSSSMAGNRACRLTYHMFENYEPRTHRDRFVTLAFIHRSHNKMPFDFIFFFIDLALAFRVLSPSARFLTFFPLLLSFSRSLSKTLLANAFHTFHTSYLSYERRSKGLHEICFIMISDIIIDFCSFLCRILIDMKKLYQQKLRIWYNIRNEVENYR